MLSGLAPFVADDSAAVIYQVINIEPQPLAKRAPDLPAGVEPVLRRALSKRMTDRYPSMREFSRALQEAAFGVTAEVTPSPEVLPAGPLPGDPIAFHRQDPPEAAAQTEPDAVKQVTTFSQTAGELTERVFAGRLRPVHAIVAAVGLVLALSTWLWFGLSRATRRPITGASPAALVPVVTSAPVPAPVIIPIPAPPAPEHIVKSTTGVATDRVRSAETAHKRKAPKAHHKRPIFQNL
jgi:hypothetical protein